MLHFRSPDIGMFGRRQRHARGHRIPVTIVTSANQPAQGPGTVVVRDNFGADEVLPPGIGCQCCTVRAKLQVELRRLVVERDQGKHFNRVMIVTRADLWPILRTFATERALTDEFYLEGYPSAAAFGTEKHGIRSFTLTEDAPLSWNAFSRFIATLTTLRGADMFHVKGLLNIAGCRGPIEVQFVQHLAHRPIELQAWPDGDRASRVTFVTRNCSQHEVAALFEAVCALTS